MRTAKRILAEFMTVVMVLQACSPTVAAVAAGWQNISSEIAAAAAEASDAAENGETKNDAATGSGASDTDGADDSAKNDAAKDDASDGTAGSDSAGDQTENDNTAGAAGDDTDQDTGTTAPDETAAQAGTTITKLDDLVTQLEDNGAQDIVLKSDSSGIESFVATLSPALAVLSNADAKLYQYAQIKINLTGDADLTLKAKMACLFKVSVTMLIRLKAASLGQIAGMTPSSLRRLARSLTTSS